MQPIGTCITKHNNNFAPGPDPFVAKSSYYQETKPPFKSMHGPGKYHDEHKTSLNVSMDRAAPIKSYDFAANNRHASSFNTPSKALSLWDQPQSPTASIKTACNSSTSSKESLWASAQSSPNSVQRDQLKQQLFVNSSNLWENPSSKVSQASLMSKNDSNNSIWCTPPRMHSPSTNTGWTNAPMNQKKDDYTNDGHALVRPQDLSPTEHHWANSSCGSGANSIKTKMDAFDSKWGNTSMEQQSFNRISANAFTSTPIKPTVNKLTNETSNGNGFGTNDVNSFYHSMATTSSGGTAPTATPASSSCLQLFSDEFINYLNMIN